VYPEQLYKQILADAEVTPPEGIWYTINTLLDEMALGRGHHSANRLSEAEIAPPADAWQALERRLTEMQAADAATRIPDLSKWALPLPLVQSNSNDDAPQPIQTPVPVINIRKKRWPAWASSAAGLLLLLLALVWRQTMHSGYRFETAFVKIEPVKKAPQSITPYLQQYGEDDSEYSYDANSQEYLVEGISSGAEDAAKIDKAKAEGALATRPLAEDARLSPGLYVLATLPDGKTVVISKRIAAMLQSNQLTVDEHAMLINSRLQNWRSMVDSWLLENGHPVDLSDPVSLAQFLDKHR
jgi:hypothetical protein